MSQITLLKHRCRFILPATDMMNKLTRGRRMQWLFLFLSALWQVPVQAGTTKDSINNIMVGQKAAPHAALRIATKGPGGVTQGLGGWYRGDKGLASSQWNDFSGNDIHIPQPTVGLQPGVNPAGVNFNPAATFNGNQYFGKRMAIDPASSVFGTDAPTKLAIFSVAIVTEGATGGVFFQQVNSGQNSGIEATPAWTTGAAIFDAPYPTRATASWGGAIGKPNVWSFTKTTSNMTILRDRNTVVSTNGSYTFTGPGANYASNIGLWDNNHPAFYKGSIPEVIVYKDISTLSVTDQQKIESYLALKYGITLNQTIPTDYLASDGSKMWTGDATFKNRITGIGRDDASSLEQKQSLSVDSGYFTLALGSQVVASNAANTGSVTNDLSFLVMGDNGLATDNFGTAVSTPLNAGISTRMPRVWKVQKTNWADQSITLKANFTGGFKYLLISTDPAFPSASITKVIPFNGNTITFNSSDLPATAYVTIGVAAKGPGGVNAGIAAWYRGDKGLSGGQWNDFSGLDINISQPTAGLQPAIDPGTANFNPTPLFDGTRFFGKGAVVDPATSVFGNLQVQQLAVFAVAAPNAAATNTLFCQETDAASNRILTHLPWSDGNVYVDLPYAFRQSVTWGGTYKRMSVWSFTKTPALITASRDRNALINKPGNYTFTGNGANYAFNIGAVSAGTGVYNGNIPELIVYKDISTLTAIDQQKIESYLALKYGITLNQTIPTDYLASDGTKMWMGNATYKNCITGIGRDDASALEQKQSLNVDAGIITLVLGSQVANTNAANTNSITNDRSFLVVADNGLASASYDIAASTPLNGAVTRRMARVWKVQKTNWADQTITLRATNISGSTKYLLISNTDPAFASANITRAIQLSGNTVTLTSSDLPNGAYFTFGSAVTAPGGVFTNLDLWMKANDGVLTGDGTKVSAWKNQVNNGYDVSTTTVACQPVFYNRTVSQLINFNPSVVYTGAEDPRYVLRNTGRLFPNTFGFQFIGVGMDRRTTWTGTAGGLLASGPGGNNPVIYLFKNGGTNGWSAFMGSGSTGPAVSPAALNNSTAIIYNGGSGAAYSNVQPQIFSMGSLNQGTSASADNIACWVDGFKENTNLDAVQQPEIGNGIFVGSSDDNSTWFGNIPEVIVYERQLSDVEMARVNSYLAIKYGVTMDQRTPYNYVATDNAVIWNASNNKTYKNNITGIGRDDAQDLRQKQSRSVNAGMQVAVGIGDLAATNADNSASFAIDKAYLVWGDDSGAVNFRTVVTGHPVVNFRMARIWKTQQTTAMTEQVQVAIPFDVLPNAKETYLIVSNDNIFDGTDQYIKLSEITLQGVKHYAAKVNLTNGQYFTFGAYIKAPGGVPGTSLWLRPDYGTSSVSDGTAIGTWTDYAADLNNATADPAIQPIYANNPADNVNFNPQIMFPGNRYMNLDANKLPTGTSPRTLFGFGKPTSLAANAYILSWGTNSQSRGQGLANIGGAGYYVGITDDVKNPGFWKLNTPDVFVGTFTGPAGGNIAATYSKTKALLSEAHASWNTGAQIASVGRFINNTIENWRGSIGDVIVYPFVLNNIELRRVESYLAIKYGYTLDQTSPGGNYLATNGSVIWNAAANGAYKVNIAGIGLDNVEGLEQKQSRSIHDGSIVAIGLNAIASTNLNNAGTFDNDRSYMFWASNSNSMATITGNLPTGKCVLERLSQQWKVQYASFDPAAKQLAFNFDLNNITYSGVDTRDFTLLIDNDGDGNFATGTITEYKAVNYDAAKKVVSFTGVSNIPAGAVFTLTTSQPMRIAKLVADGQAQNATSICREDDWIYFKDPTDATKYIAAIYLNGNTVNMTDFNAALADVSQSMDNLGKNSGTDYGTQLMRRLLQIKYTGVPLTINGGVKLRYFWNPAEQGAAGTYLSGTRNVATTRQWSWFRHAGDVTATLNDLTPVSLENAVEIVPTSTGSVDGVDYIEFEGLQQFDVFGGMYKASQVVSVRKVQDGAEGGPDGQFSIELPLNVTVPEDLIVTYTVSGTASNGADYQTLNGQITLPSGASQVPLPVLVIDDNVIELTEDVQIQLTTVTGAATGNLYSISNTRRQASLVITDNDQNKAVLGVTKIADAAEPSTNGTFSISLPATVTSSEDITVTYSVAGTATNGTDYTKLTGTLVIPKGMTSVDLPVQVLDDKLIEGPETVVLTLAGGTSANFNFVVDATAAAATMTIADDDNTTANQVVSITRNADAAEPATNGSFLVSLPAGYTAAQPITVNYTVGGTATPDADYTPLAGAIVIPAGHNSVLVDVIVKNDEIIEGDETVVATITDATAPVLGTFAPDNTHFSATVTIADDDNIALNKVLRITRVADAAEPHTNGRYKISLPAGITAAEAITVNYTMSGTATNGADYTTMTGTIVLQPGDNNVPLDLVVEDDKIIEGDETAIATLAGGNTATLGAFTVDAAAKAATITIVDDDNIAANKVLHISAKTDAAEPSTHGAFEIGLPTDVTAAGPITVNYTITGTASNGADYQPLNGTITIPAGQNTIPLPVTVIDDKIIEGNETVITTLNGGNAAAFGAFTIDATAQSATVNIADDDNTATNLVLNISKTADAAEPSTDGAFSIALPDGYTASEDITIHYTISGTATNDIDYQQLTSPIVLPAGSNAVTLPVVVKDDKIIEGDEVVTITLGNGASASFALTAGTSKIASLTIADDDNVAKNKVISAVKVADGAEPSTNGAFRLQLPTDVTAVEAISVQYSISGTATNGVDYVTLNGSAVIPAGANGVDVAVKVIDDDIIEGDETVIITATGGNAPTFGSFTADATPATVIIKDDDNVDGNKVLSITKTADAAEPGTNGEFKISLPAGVTLSQPVTVNYTVGGTATNDVDYEILNGTVVIPAGQNSVLLPVVVKDDKIIEVNETVIVNISGGTTASYGVFTASSTNGSATVTIADDDNTIANTALTIAKTADAAEPSTNGSFSINLPAGITSSEDIIVHYTVTGTATPDADYIALKGTAVIPAGEPGVSIPVTVIDDKIIEIDETVVATLTGGASTHFTFTGTGTASVIIADDDNVPGNKRVTVLKMRHGGEPATSGRFGISLFNGYTSSEPVTVNYTISGTATNGVDYITLNGTAIIPVGQTQTDVLVDIIDDKIIEGTETVIMTLTQAASPNISFSIAGGPATVNIADDDNTAANKTLHITKTADAAEPSTNGEFTIGLPADVTVAEDVTVHYQVSGTATNGVDYETLDGTIVIPAGQNSVKLPVIVKDDSIVEGDESVIVTLMDGVSAHFAFTVDSTANSAAVIIADDDNISGSGELSIAKTTDAAEPSTNGVFTISLPAGITYAKDITVNYIVSGTATPGADYTTLTGSAVIPAGRNSVTVTVQVLDDDIIEGTETVIATLTAGTAAGFSPLTVNAANSTATVNIADDDDIAANKVISIVKTANAAEPSTNGAFKISFPAGVTVVENVTVNYTITGTATNGTDYTTLSGTVKIPAGSNSVPLDVVVTDDKIIEGTETVIATLGAASSATFGAFSANAAANTATVNIADDDNIAANKVFTVTSTADGAEPATPGKFSISLPNGYTVSEPVTISYSIGGTATNDVDYTALNGTVTLPADQTEVMVPVNVIDDKIIEGTETVIMTLNTANSTSFGFSVDGTSATVNILDDDATTTNRTLSITKTADAAEPATNGSFRISLPVGVTSAVPIRVAYQIDGSSTATPDADYVAIKGDIIIPAGSNSVLVPVEVIDDQIIEPVEKVVMNISGGNDGVFTYTANAAALTATVFITDDDFAPNSNVVLVTKVSDAIEGGIHGQFRISLPVGVTASEPITIHYAMGGSATNTIDYATLNGVAVIQPGANFVLIDVEAFDDGIVEGPEHAIMSLLDASSTSYTFNIAPGKSNATVTIIDANAATRIPVTVTKVADAAEPGTNGKFRVSLVGGTSALPVTVGYTLSGTADNGEDYVIVNDVVIPANNPSVDVDVTVIDDKIIEGPENVVFTIISGSATDGAGNAYIFPADVVNTATVTIADDDNMGVNLELTVAKESDAAEPATHGSFRISLRKDYTASTDVTVQYNIGGTATKDVDYKINATITIPKGRNFVIVPVTVIDDKIIEPKETVILTLTGGTDGHGHAYIASGTAPSATVEIDDDDGIPVNRQLTIRRVTNGSEPATNGQFEISLPRDITSSEAITVNYIISGTADNGDDYEALSGSVVLPANQNSVLVDVIVKNDQIIEGDETVILTLAGGTTPSLGAFTGTGTATVVIADDDNTAAIRVLQVKQTKHAAEPSTNGNFHVSLPAGYSAARDITLQYTLKGTATSDVDYVVNTITLPALSNGVDIPVTVIDDKIIEPTETVIMELAAGIDNNSNDYTVDAAAGTATVNIADDDNIIANRALLISKLTDAAEPGTNGAFVISLPDGLTASEDVLVTYNITGTATNGTDYRNLSGTVILPANSNSVKVDVITMDDTIIEGDETVIMTLAGGSTNSLGAFSGTGSATVLIADDDNTSTNQVLKVVRMADAGEPSTNGSFEISLPAGVTAAQDITVNYTITGTATNGTDYQTLNGTIVLVHGQNSVPVPVIVINDEIIEGDETVILHITNGTSAGFSYAADAVAGTATVTITDDDNVSGNKVLHVVKTADAGEPATNGAFTISLPAGVTAADDITVNYTVTGTAINGTDYTIDDTAIIPAGQNSVDVPVTVIDDKIIEGDETVIMTLQNGESARFGNLTIDAANSVATVIIADDDDIAANKQLSIATLADAAEPATNGRFVISLPAGITVAEDVTVGYMIAGTATNGVDYVTLNGSVVIPAGQTSVELPVIVKDDKIIEENETVIATLTGGTSVKFVFTSAATAVVTILDDDNTTANRVVSVTKGGDAAEPSTNGSFIFSLPAGLTASAPVIVNYTIGGTATAGADYQTLPGTIIIPQGQNSVTVPAVVIDDLIIEETENVTTTITNGTAAGLGTFAASSSQGNAVVLIADNDNIPANKVLSVVKAADAAEPATNGAFTISLPNGVSLTDDAIVNYTISGTATNGTDYTISATATIPAGQSSVTVPVVVIDDKIIEGTETVILTLKDGKSRIFGDLTVSPTLNVATVNITDDDDIAANRMLSVTKVADAAEPATNGSFRVSLPAGFTAAQTINVNYTISGTATNGIDYTIPGTAIITAGAEEVIIPVTVIDDKIIEGPEDVVLTLNGGTTASMGDFTVNNASAAATVTIADDDDVAANLVVNITATQPNAAEPSTNGEVTIALPTDITATVPVTVQYTIAGTATGGTDYKALSGTAIIPAGANSVAIPVEVIDNKIQDGTRTVVFTLTGGTGGIWTFVPGTAKTATVNISDDDIQSFDTWKTVALPADNTSGAAHPNETLTYTIFVHNTGNVPLTQVTITDPVPANTIYVSGGILNGNVVAFTINNLAPGATATATLIVKTPASLEGVTSISNTAQVSDGTTTKPTGGCNPAAPGCNGQPGTVIEASNISGDLAITKTVVNPQAGPYRMGQDITYSVKVKSNGNAVFTNVVVEDLLPPNLEMPKTIYTQTGLVDKTTGRVTWTIASLPAGQEVELTMVCRIVEGGDIINRATVTAREPETDNTNNTAEVTIRAEGADLNFPNVFTPNGDGKNDRFVIGGLEKYPGSAIYIYNRWGSMVYQSKDYRNDWNGSQLNEATYYYILEVRKPTGVVRYKGWVQILR